MTWIFSLIYACNYLPSLQFNVFPRFMNNVTDTGLQLKRSPMYKFYINAHCCSRWLFFIAIILLAPLALSAKDLQDTGRISLQVTAQPVEAVIRMIEKQTGKTFYYGAKARPENKPVTIHVKNAALPEVLGMLFQHQPIQWKIGKDYIVLTPAKPPASGANDLSGDSLSAMPLTGRVVGRNGEAVMGATVLSKANHAGTITDDDGRFVISGIGHNEVLEFSSLGYTTRQMKTGGRSYLHVTLDAAISEIKTVEVVSTGYQSIPKERVTGSFVLLDSRILNRTPSVNILDRIRYVTNGLNYVTPQMQGFTKTSYIIRGVSTINAGRSPLIVIDGFPYEEGDNPEELIRRLNPNDVESITVLKDAAAASIWGARSGNGVIVITTKRGKYNMKPEFNVSANLTVTERPRLTRLPVISSADAVDFEKRRFATGFFNNYDDSYPANSYFPVASPVVELMLAARRGEMTGAELDAALSEMANHSVWDDVSQYMTRPAFNQQYSVSYKGGSDRSSYYFSGGYDRVRQDAVNTFNERFTFDINNSYKISKVVEVGYIVNYANTTDRQPYLNYRQLIPVTAGDRWLAPYTALADEAGNALPVPFTGGLRKKYIDTLSAPGILDWNYRPLDELNHVSFKTRGDNLRAGANIRINIIKGLSADVKGMLHKLNSREDQLFSLASFDARDNINRFSFQDQITGNIVYPYPLGARLVMRHTKQNSFNLRGQLNYEKHWRLHQVNMLAGGEISETKAESNISTLYGYNEENLTNAPVDFTRTYRTRPSGAMAMISSGNGVTSYLNRFLSYYGNFSYVYGQRYTLTGSIRWDAANLFGVNANDRRVPLWSGGLAWNILKESFMQPSSALDQLNLRFTYGWNGNLLNSASALPVISYRNTVNAYQAIPDAIILRPPNPNLTWEKVKTWNIGLDFSLLNRRLSGVIEYYQKNGEDLIGPIVNDITKGFSNYLGNYAAVKSKGIDVQLNAVPVETSQLHWRSIFNVSFNTNKTSRYDYTSPGILEDAGTYLVGSYPIVGRSLFDMYVYKWGGLNGKNGDPQGYLADTLASYDLVVKGKNTRPQDLIRVGSRVPRIFGNFMNNIAWKDLVLSFNIRYNLDYYFQRPSVFYDDLLNNWTGHSDYADRWQQPGDEKISNIPAESLRNNALRDLFYRQSYILVEKGDNIRLQDIVLEYTLPDRLISSSIAGVTLRAMVSNVGIIWRANGKGLDPENMHYPASRSYTFSANVRL